MGGDIFRPTVGIGSGWDRPHGIFVKLGSAPKFWRGGGANISKFFDGADSFAPLRQHYATRREGVTPVREIIRGPKIFAKVGSYPPKTFRSTAGQIAPNF